jgi:hypothetical protein
MRGLSGGKPRELIEWDRFVNKPQGISRMAQKAGFLDNSAPRPYPGRHSGHPGSDWIFHVSCLSD